MRHFPLTRSIIFSLLGVLVITYQAMGEVHPNVSSVLTMMQSQTWTERSKGFQVAAELLASQPSPTEADQLRLGVIHLLAIENNDKTSVADESEGEDQSEYYAGLISYVADLKDERAIPALLGAAMTGGMAIRGVSQFGNRAVPHVIAQVRSTDVHLSEGALFVILNMLEFHTVTDSNALQQINATLRTALARPEELIRETAIAAIEYLNDREEFVPMLHNIAERDPYKINGARPDDDQDHGELFPVRRAARLLLRQIANHEAPVVDRGISR
jgi:hypothetical protein